MRYLQAVLASKRITDPRMCTSLIVTAHVVAEPYDRHRLSNVPATGNEVERKIASTNRNTLHIQQYGVSDGSNTTTNDDGSETVFEAVRHNCCCEGKDCGDDEDWDAHHLRMNCFPSELGQDRRCKE